MNDDELRSILKSEADRVEPGEHSWSRLASRLERSAERSAPRSFALGAVAIAVVVALVAVVLPVGRERQRRQVAAGSRSAPARILAVNADGWLVLLDARYGRELRRYLANPAPGTPIAVSPDAKDFYFASGDDDAGCRGESIERRPIDPGPGSATLATGAIEPTISPDGRYLAFYRCFGSGATAVPRQAQARALVVRDLTTGVDAVSFLPPNPDEGFGRALAFDADSRHLVYELVQAGKPAGDGSDRLFRFDPLAGEELPGQGFGLAPRAFRGTLGDSGSYVAVKGRNVLSIRCARCPDTSVFAAGRLLRMPRAPHVIASDRTGAHLLLVSGRTLYRWSEGDKRPTKIRDGIVAAAWIPDDEVLPVAPSHLLVARLSKTRARPGDHLTLAIDHAKTSLGVVGLSWSPDPLLLEHRRAGRWVVARDVRQKTFQTPAVRLPFPPSGSAPRTKFTVPRVRPGRYRICSEVALQSPEFSGRAKVCAPFTVLRR